MSESGPLEHDDFAVFTGSRDNVQQLDEILAEAERARTHSGTSTADAVGGDLTAALDGLLRLSVGEQSLELSLVWIATLAVLAIPLADGAGLTMLETGHPQTMCVSHPFVRDVDDVQYTLDEGPCVTAAGDRRTVISGTLGSDLRWPRFAARVRRFDVNSALSLPLITSGGDVLGAINVYAHKADAFSANAVRHGELFASAAAVAVMNARTMMQTSRLAAQLKTALTSRSTIDHAIGIVMSRQGVDPEDAFGTLRRLSQAQNIKLALVAEQIVEEAVQRARARHAGG